MRTTGEADMCKDRAKLVVSHNYVGVVIVVGLEFNLAQEVFGSNNQYSNLRFILILSFHRLILFNQVIEMQSFRAGRRQTVRLCAGEENTANVVFAERKPYQQFYCTHKLVQGGGNFRRG